MAKRPDFLTSPHSHTRTQRTTNSHISNEPDHTRFFSGLVNSLILSAVLWAAIAAAAALI